MSSAAPALAPAWTAWIAENALRGASRAELCAGLVQGGVPEASAGGLVDEVLQSPILAGAQALVARSAGIEQVARLRKALDDGPVAELRLHEVDDDRLFREWWTPHRPLVLRGAAADWPAWTPASLAERFGDVEVTAVVGRAAAPRWFDDRAAHSRRMPLRELLARAEGPASDDVYADARCRLLDEPGLAPLRAEIGPLPGLAPQAEPFAWIGPAGTVTRLHHDQSTGWLVQRCGRKRVWLAAPWEAALLATADGLYNRADAALPGEALREVRWHELVLEPGDAVLLPVGWWHQVRAEAPSISVSMGRFRWPNHFPWYLPGRRQAG
ncbi:MAG: cupin-like domain-containing protein [Myxococcota bacterium]